MNRAWNGLAGDQTFHTHLALMSAIPFETKEDPCLRVEPMSYSMRAMVFAALFSIPVSAAVAAGSITLTSPAFKDNDMWPAKYSCDQPGPTVRGQNVSPPLTWANPPVNTKSFVLIMQDPDGGLGMGSYHWIAYDIPPSVTSIEEGRGSVEPTQWVGGNLGATTLYRGPCAPLGQGVHHYIINIIATDIAPRTLKPGLNHDELMKEIRGHALATASIVARFQRQ
jgi:Raf kinase inhibitor-like YbhB/YbcL family protein